MKAAFYYVDEDYIAYLKNTEIDYFVPVSSYIKKQEDNIVIKVSDREKKGGKAGSQNI